MNVDHPFYKVENFSKDTWQTYTSNITSVLPDWYTQHRRKRSDVLSTSRDLIPLRYIENQGDDIQNEFLNLWEFRPTYTTDQIQNFESFANVKMFEKYKEIVGPYFCTDIKLQLNQKKNMQNKFKSPDHAPSDFSSEKSSTTVSVSNSIKISVISPNSESVRNVNNFLEDLRKGQEIFYDLLNRTDCTSGAIKFINEGFAANLNAVERFEKLKKSEIIIKDNDFYIRTNINIRNVNSTEGQKTMNQDWKASARLSIQHAFMKVFPEKYKGLFSTDCQNQGFDTTFNPPTNCDLAEIPKKEYTTKEKRNCDLKYNVLTLINAFLECEKANNIAQSYFESIKNEMKRSNSIRINVNNQVVFNAVGSFYMVGNIVTADTKIDVITSNVYTISSSIGEAIAAEILSGAYACLPGYEALSYLVKAECSGPKSLIIQTLEELEDTASSSNGTSSSNQGSQITDGSQSFGNGSDHSGGGDSASNSCANSCGNGTVYSNGRCISNLTCDSIDMDAKENSSKKDVIIVSTITGVITCVIVLILSILILKN